MVAETPTDGRCNAHVTDKVGLVVECRNESGADSVDEFVITDHDFDVVRLQSPDDLVVECAPSYEHTRKFLWDDYELTHIAVPVGADGDRFADENGVSVVAHEDMVGADTRSGSPETDLEDHQWLDVSEIVENVTNRDKELQGYCEKYPMKEEGTSVCYSHQGGGPAEGNTNAMTHGLYAQRTNFYQALGQEDKQFVEAMVDSWVNQAPFGRDNPGMVNTLYRVAIDQLRAWFAIDEFVDENGSLEGVTKVQEVEIDGEYVELEDEHPANMPYSRLSNDIRMELKDLGVYDSPEQQQAEATSSLAQKLSGLADD